MDDLLSPEEAEALLVTGMPTKHSKEVLEERAKLLKLSYKARLALNEGKITLVQAHELVELTHERQDEMVSAL